MLALLLSLRGKLFSWQLFGQCRSQFAGRKWRFSAPACVHARREEERSLIQELSTCKPVRNHARFFCLILLSHKSPGMLILSTTGTQHQCQMLETLSFLRLAYYWSPFNGWPLCYVCPGVSSLGELPYVGLGGITNIPQIIPHSLHLLTCRGQQFFSIYYI